MGRARLRDASTATKWRAFTGESVPIGTAEVTDHGLVWSVAPGEWTRLGGRRDADDVDLSHVRALLYLEGDAARATLEKICALDFSEDMFPSGRAVRTSVAGVTVEIFRFDETGWPSYALLPSRSFAAYLVEVIVDAGTEFSIVGP